MKRAVRMLLILLLLCSNACAETVHILWADLSDPFCAQTRLALEEAFSASGISLVHENASLSQWTQIDQAEAAVASAPSLLCIQTCEYASLTAARTVLEAPVAAGIPVIFFGRQIAPSLDGIHTFLAQYDQVWYVHHDQADIGKSQGAAAGAYLAAHYAACDLNGDGYISTVVLQGDPYDTDASARATYAIQEADRVLSLDGYPALIGPDSDAPAVYADPECMWSAEFGRNTMSELLTVFSPSSGQMIELVLCGNDDMANGTINALTRVGYNSDLPGAPSIPVYGVDGTLLSRELISGHRMTGSVARSPEHMAQALSALCMQLLGKESSIPEETRVDNHCLFPPYDVISQ